jgi:hypothetical protein
MLINFPNRKEHEAENSVAKCDKGSNELIRQLGEIGFTAEEIVTLSAMVMVKQSWRITNGDKKEAQLVMASTIGTMGDMISTSGFGFVNPLDMDNLKWR